MGMQCPPRPGPGIERHEAEWLGGRRVDHFPYVDAHAVAHQRDLIGQADIDHAERILEQLDHLGHLRRADRNHFLQRLRVEYVAHFRTSGRRAANHFRNVRGVVLCIARIDSFRREAQKEILAHLQAALLEHGQHNFVGGTGIGRRFQNDQHSGMEDTWRSRRTRTRCSSCPGLWSCAAESARRYSRYRGRVSPKSPPWPLFFRMQPTAPALRSARLQRKNRPH